MRNKFLLHAAVASLALMAGTAAHAQTYSNAVMALNPPPVGYWPLQETTPPPTPGSLNLTAHNSGSLGITGDGLYGAWYQANGASWYVTNNVVLTNAQYTGDGSKALWCQSVSNTAVAGQYVVVPHTTNGVVNEALTIKAPFSVECWAYIRSINGAARILVAQGTTRVNCGGSDPNNAFNGGTFQAMAGFELLQYQDYISFMTCATNNFSKPSLQTSVYNTYTGFKVGQLLHIVATLDEAGNKKIYTNGVLCASGGLSANAAGLKYVPDTASPIMIGSGPEVSISKAVPSESVYAPYSGVLDEVAIYTNALTVGQALAHYQAAANGTYSTAVLADSPMLYYRFDDSITPANAGYTTAAFPTANNYGSEGANANGLYQPGTTPGVAGPSYAGFGPNSRAVALNGAFGTVNIGNGNLPVSLNPTGAVPLTVVSWFKGGPADSPNRFQQILGHSDRSYRLALGQAAGDNHFNAGPGPELQFDNPADLTTNGFALNDGKWHMVAGVSDGTHEYLYLDGRLAKSATNTSGITIVGTNLDLVLGGDPQYTYASGTAENSIRTFNGSIAHVAFWTNALSTAQIQQLYGAAGVPPTLAQQPPAAVNLNAGSTLSVPVVAYGSAPLTYQWFKNGGSLSTQTTSALTLNPVALSDAGTYYVRVSNSAGNTNSTSLVLTVNGPPVLTDQSPTTMKVFVGTTPVLHVSANGPQPISYQWSKNGSAISGATQSAYQLSSTTDTGSTGSSTYSCSINNTYGPVSPSFSTITVQVVAKPTAPYPLQVLADNPAYYFRLNETDDGAGNNGVTAWDYAGGCNAFYTNTLLSQSGYSAATDPSETSAYFGYLATSDCFAGKGSAYLNFATPAGNNAQFSIEAWINSVYTPSTDAGVVTIGYGYGGEQFCIDCGGRPNGASGPRALRFYVLDASNVNHGVIANSTTNLLGDGRWHHLVGVCDEAGGKVSFYVDGVLAGNTTISSGAGLKALTVPLSIGARQPANGSLAYTNQFPGMINDVSLYNVALSSNQVVSHYVAAGIAPTFVQAPPATLTTNAGATVVLSATALGTPALNYQWQLNFGDIPGATTSTLTLNNVSGSMNNNFYTLNVNNAYGSATVTTILYVNAGPPTFTADLTPLVATNYTGRAFTYSVVCDGTAPFTYQWYRDGSAVSGATASSYTFPTLNGQHAYYVKVSNPNAPAGVNSSTATLTGMAAPTLQPSDYTGNAKITFAGYTRGEVLADFPALVVLTNIPGFNSSQLADPNGGDLRFTDASGTNVIAHEIDDWNPAGSVLTAWVQVPRLATTNDFIMAYWGNAAATTPEAWSTNGTVWRPQPFEGLPPYHIVYHLKEGAMPFLDSTGQHTTSTGNAPGAAPGLIGTCADFGVNQYQYLNAGPVEVGDVFTLSAWVNVPTLPNPDQVTIWANKPGGYITAGFAMFVNTYKAQDNRIDLATGNGTSGDESKTAVGSVLPNQWHLLTAALNRTNGVAQFYVDGASAGSSSSLVKDFPTFQDLNLGRLTNGGANFHGLMDEARIQQGNASANWIWADYMTVAQNTTFAKYGTAVVTAPPTLTAQVVGGNLVLTWSSGTLIASTSLSTPLAQWQPVTGATSPYSIPLTSIQSGTRYFRVKQ